MQAIKLASKIMLTVSGAFLSLWPLLVMEITTLKLCLEG